MCCGNSRFRRMPELHDEIEIFGQHLAPFILTAITRAALSFMSNPAEKQQRAYDDGQYGVSP